MSKIRELRRGSHLQLTPNFNSDEFDCTCKYQDCKVTLVDMDHVALLQKLREKLKKSIRITSAYRCEKHNKDVGGATNSRHKMGDATDITVSGMSPKEVADLCENFQGLGRYDSFTHIDSRPTEKKARWDLRRKK